MSAEATTFSDGFLVIAHEEKSTLHIYMGSLRSIVDQRQRLPRANKSTGDYQFTYRAHGRRHIAIDQIPGMYLDEIASFPKWGTQPINTQRA